MIVVLIGVWSHAGYQNVSPGLGEHVGKFFLWPIAFPATLWKFDFQLFLTKKFGFWQNMVRLANLAGRSADVANLI